MDINEKIIFDNNDCMFFPFHGFRERWQGISSSVSGDVKAKIVALHNKYRAEVEVPPVKWSEAVQKSAEEWALHLAEDEGFVWFMQVLRALTAKI